MSTISQELRAAVAARAEHRCEYCRLPDQLQVGGFELDHIVPQSRGGPTASENLAYACPHCNGNKSDQVDAIDPASGRTIALFNPRTQGWADHFRWSTDRPFEIEGVTACGRATLVRLQVNHSEMVGIRRALAELGISVSSAS